MANLTAVTLGAALVLALALVIERTIELLKAAYDLVDSRYDLYHFWTRRAIAIRDFAEKRLRVFEYVSPDAAQQYLDRYSDWLLGPEHGYSGTVPTLAGDLVRATGVRLMTMLVGMAIGVSVAFAMGLDLFRLYGQPAPAVVSGTLVTGIAMGLGAGPVHTLIKSLEKKRAAQTVAQEGANG